MFLNQNELKKHSLRKYNNDYRIACIIDITIYDFDTWDRLIEVTAKR
jgi:hypothetical protein